MATPYRHGSKESAEQFFLSGMTEAMRRIANTSNQAYPISIYYAFKQSETKADSGTSSTGWVTFLDAVLSAGMAIVGTWPMRSELATRNIGRGNNGMQRAIGSIPAQICDVRWRSGRSASKTRMKYAGGWPRFSRS